MFIWDFIFQYFSVCVYAEAKYINNKLFSGFLLSGFLAVKSPKIFLKSMISLFLPA